MSAEQYATWFDSRFRTHALETFERIRRSGALSETEADFTVAYAITRLAAEELPRTKEVAPLLRNIRHF